MSLDHSFVYENTSYTDPESSIPRPSIDLLPTASILFPHEPICVRANVLTNDEHLIIQWKVPPLPSTLSVSDVEYKDLFSLVFYVTNSDMITLQNNIIDARLTRNSSSPYVFKHDIHIHTAFNVRKYTIHSIETHPNISSPITTNIIYEPGDILHIDNLYVLMEDKYIAMYENKQPTSLSFSVIPLHYALINYKHLITVTSFISTTLPASISVRRNTESSYTFKQNIHIQSMNGDIKQSFNNVITEPGEVYDYQLLLAYETNDQVLIDTIFIYFDGTYVGVFEDEEPMRILLDM